ncbi:ABC transporter permease subunit [Alkalihalobacillus sp. FSL R5-0424]
MNTQRIAAIFEKDYKDFMKNSSLLVTAAIPIFMALLYSQMDFGGEMTFAVFTIVGITLSAVTAGSMITMMAEEKEKNTLRGLIQSPASFIDIIIGKCLLTSVVTIIVLGISLLLIGFEPLLETRMIIGTFLAFIFFLFLGIGVGLFAKTLASTYVYTTPIMLVFGFTPILLGIDFFINNKVASTIIEYFPMIQLLEIDETSSWAPIGIIGIWLVASIIFAFVLFKKAVKDD